MRAPRLLAVAALAAACGSASPRISRTAAACGSASPRISSTTAEDVAADVTAHLGTRAIDIVVRGTYGRGLSCGSGSVTVLGAEASIAQRILRAAHVTSWVCIDGLCRSEGQVEVGPVACVLTEHCGEPLSDDLAAHLGGRGDLALVFEGSSEAPVLVGLVVGVDGDVRAELDRARRDR